MVVEIEDKNGNTLCAFRIRAGIITRTHNCEVSDCDDDYIFGSKEHLVRVQVEDEGEK